ncbi:MAG: hypothetical protein AABY78_03380 [Nitrospirota bacterium]
MRSFIIFLLLGLSTLFFGCDSGGGGTTGPTTTYNVTGTWTGTVSGGSMPPGETITLNLTQSGNVVTGTVQSETETFNITSGSFSDRTLQISFTPPESLSQVNVTGTISDDGNRISGTWTAGTETGSFEVRRV